MSVPANRFQVSCSECGHITEDKTFKEALKQAKHYEFIHKDVKEKIAVFDLMAHKGNPELWDSEGNVLKIKC